MDATKRIKHVTHFIRDNRCDEWATPKVLTWLEKHTTAWNTFCEVVDQARKRGMPKWSARAAMDVVRWQMFDGIDRVKYSNTITPALGRLYNLMYCANTEDFLTTRPLLKPAS